MNNEEVIRDLINYEVSKNNMFLITKEEYDKYINQGEEIERLNNIIKQKDNIINELEKYLKEQIDEHYSWHYREWIRQVLNKLKELKEGK